LSITTYSELQAAVQNWLHRSDSGLTNRVPEFIALCEAKYNRKLRISPMESRNASFTVSAQYATLPTDFLEVRSIQITGDTGRQLEYLTPNDMRARYRDSNTNVPKYYTVIAGSFEFAPVPNGTYNAELIYFAPIAALSNSNTTNWMLTNNPDIYLYGALMEAAPFMKNPDLQTWAALFTAAMKDVQDADNRSDYGGPLMMRVG
jgi:hypothetical protein